jgi:DNA-binding transcriptional MerR regulator
MKTYDVPHKGLRNALSQLSLLAGKTDYANPQEVYEFYQLGQDVFSLLNIHAADENEVTLAELEARCPKCSQHDVEDHERLHQMQEKLEKLLSQIHSQSQAGSNVLEDGAEFYLAFSEFQGTYLEHTAEEERVTQPLLWKYFTDEELAAHRGRIMAKNPPKTLLTWFRFVIPAQRHAERVSLLTGFKKMASESFYNDGLATIQKVLTTNDYNELETALALV